MAHMSIVTFGLSVGCILLPSCSNTRGTQGTTGPSKGQATTISSKTEIVQLLRQSLSDSEAWNKRLRMQSDKNLWGQFRGAKHWYKEYPVSYAKERLIARGSSVIPVLRDIIHDKNCADVHYVAIDVLGKLDPPAFLKELYRSGKDQSVSPGQVSHLVQFGLPVLGLADYWHDDKVIDWLGKQLDKKSYDEIVLGLMDDFLKAKYADGGMYPGLMDEGVLRWLDRVYDVDLDSWLSAKAPSVLKFRHEQLSKGYDTATCFDLGNNASYGLLDEAMAAIYPKLEDQKACKELLEAVYPNELPGGKQSPLHPKRTPGWEQRLKDWYWSQRASLQYDPALLRFVSRAGYSTTRPASVPGSQ